MMKEKKHFNKKILAVIIVVLAILLAGTACVIYFISMKKDVNSSAYLDPNASDWDDEIDSSDEETQGKILVPGYTGAKMQAGDTVLKIRIGNPGENTCYLKATVQLEDGTVLYESGLLEPGTGLEEIQLQQTLEAGTYDAVVHYQGYTMDEKQDELNSCDSAFTLTVTP